MHVKIIVLVFLLFSINVTLFADTGQKNKLNDTGRDSIYNSFLYEKTLCQKFVKIIAKDKAFIENFEYLNSDEKGYGQRLSEKLSKSKVANNKVIQYIQKHTNYFIVDQAFESCPGEIYVKDTPIYCTQTDKRLKELEAFAPSAQSWKVREHYLNISLANLLEIGMPWSEGGGVSYDFETLRAEVDEAKKLYSGQFKEPLKKWVQKAITAIKKEANNTSYHRIILEQELRQKGHNTNYYLTLKEKHMSEVGRWIAELNKGLE